jgi:hypothetical protein
MRLQRLESAPLVVLGFVLLPTLLIALSVIGMRMARHWVYADIAASCARVSLLTVDDTRYFSAPVSRTGHLPQPPAVVVDQAGTIRL